MNGVPNMAANLNRDLKEIDCDQINFFFSEILYFNNIYLYFNLRKKKLRQQVIKFTSRVILIIV